MFLQHTAAPAPRLYKCSLPSANLRVDASRLDGWPVDHVLNRFPGRVPGVRTVVEFRLVAGGDLSIFYRLDLGLTQLDGFSGIGPSGSKPPARHLPVCQPILRGLPGRLGWRIQSSPVAPGFAKWDWLKRPLHATLVPNQTRLKAASPESPPDC